MDIELKLVCENCGYKNRKGGSQVEHRINIKCRNCGSKIVLDAGKLQACLHDLERAVKEGNILEFTLSIK